MSEPRHALVLLGATGFTGRLVAETLARRLVPGQHDWAIAGRDVQKLRDVRDQVVAIEPRWRDLRMYEADTSRFDSLTDLAARARVLMTTVGPYVEHGEPVVKACLEQGADYLDLTGEPAYWHRIVAAYHERAVEAKVCIVPCCGFDSVPADLGVFFAVRELHAHGPVEVDAYVTAVGSVSGGTWASALGVLADRGGGSRRTDDRRAPRPKIHFAPEVRRWVLPMPVIDPAVVKRSAALVGGPYGEPFTYRQFMQTKSLAQVIGLAVGVSTLGAAAKIPFVRERLRALRPSGSGPSPDKRARSWFRVHVVARGDGREVRVQVSGGDPGYGETPKMFVEAALCLVEERADLPFAGGVLTPASGMGPSLVQRLREQGLQIERSHS